MINILILEDNKDSLEALAKMVSNISREIEVYKAASIEEARNSLEGKQMQAFLLDINLNIDDEDDTSGLDFAKEVRSVAGYAFTPIVMVTSLATLELQAYRELHCYQYILKPYREEDVVKIVKNVLFQAGQSVDKYILVKKDGINYKLNCKDISYIKAITRGVEIVMEDKMKVPYVSIKQLMEKLPEESFIQCHRMYVVNRDKIDYIDWVNRLIHICNGDEIEVGVTYKNEVKRRMDG